MAKRRLNKKVALVGSVVFVFLVLAVIGLILHLSRDPEKFIKDGDAALQAAHEAIDEQIKEEAYKRAERNYLEAQSLAKTDSLKVDMLFKLVDVYLETDQWRNVLRCWNGIIRIDSKNVKARFGRLKYIYVVADSGLRQAWKEVASQASEFIGVVENAGLLAEDTAKWEPFGMQERGGRGRQLGPYLYLLRGRAVLEITMMGAVTDPDQSLAQAVDDLEKVRKFEPGNVDVYWYLAQAAITRGDILASRGNLEERDKAARQATELLEKAVEMAGSNPRAHINLLRMKLGFARRSGAAQLQERIQAFEPEYLSLVEKFDSGAEAFSELAGFYMLTPKSIDKAIAAIEKAIELDKKDVTYAIIAANLHYRKFSIYGQKSEVYKAIEIAKNALTLPDAQESKGPRQWANGRNRISLYSFLANCYIEQVLEPCEPRTESQKQEWLTNAEQTVHEIEQIFGSGEDPQVIRWQGMLELAKGDRNIAIRKLYAAYEQLKASKPSKPPWPRDVQFAQLSYALAKVFKNTSEVGAVTEFLVSALNSGIADTRPEALLDYVEVLLRHKAWSVAISNINMFEENLGSNERSKTLRIRALLGANQFDEVEAELSHARPDDPDTIKLNLALVQAKIRQVRSAIVQKQLKESSDFSEGLAGVEKEGADELMRAELKGYSAALAKLVGELLEIEPNSVGEASIAAVCRNYIAEGKIEQGRDLVERFLEYFPDNVTVLYYKQMLSEPEPDKISQQRRREIEEEIFSNIADPIAKAMNLGVFYQRYNELEKATVEFKKVLNKTKRAQNNEQAIETLDPCELQAGTTLDIQRSRGLAVGYLFEMALGTKDWELAEQMADIAQRENIDNCEGHFFAARLAVAKKQYKDALANLDECLKQRPVFSTAYMLRSNVNAALGNEHASIVDAQKAASLNPLNGDIARVLANVLYQRDRKLGDNVSSDQIIETKTALSGALALNPADFQLLNFYAEYISFTEPSKALAIRQSLQRAIPSVGNALALGNMALRMAVSEKKAEQKKLLFGIAASAFKQAFAYEPKNKNVLDGYAEYYRLTGQEEKAKELLEQSDDKKLLWVHYFRAGRFGDAKEILEQLYKEEAKDSSVFRGLLLVATRTADKEAAKKYSEELLSLEDSIENRLIQIQTFLKVGLIKEAGYKLQSFKEKYPNELRALLLEAWLAKKEGKLKRSLELTNRNLETNQDNAAAWWLRGEINRLMANYEQAINDLKTSKSLSDEPVTRIALARAYLQAGRVEDAITELKNTIDSPQAPMQGRALLEQIYRRLNKKDVLTKFYDETLKKFPDSAIWYNRAGAFAVAGGDFSRAEKLYGRAMGTASSENLKAKNYTAQQLSAFRSQFYTSLDGYLHALVSGGKLDKVFKEAEKYIDGDFAPIAFFNMAEAKLKLDDRASAIQYCRKAVDSCFGRNDEFAHAADAEANEILAADILQRMYSLLGAKEVLQFCKERLEADPDSLAANLTMFDLMKINGEYNKAVGYIDKCLQITGPDSPRRVNYIMEKALVLQLAYNKTSDNNYLQRAIAEYESLLVKMPNNANVLNNLAYTLAENNERLADSLQYAKRAYEARPNNPSLMDTYAYVLYKNGRFSEAAEILQAALQQFEQNDVSVPYEVYEHLGMIKEGLGSGAEALVAYKQALEQGGDKLSDAAKEQIKSAIERVKER